MKAYIIAFTALIGVGFFVSNAKATILFQNGVIDSTKCMNPITDQIDCDTDSYLLGPHGVSEKTNMLTNDQANNPLTFTYFSLRPEKICIVFPYSFQEPNTYVTVRLSAGGNTVV